MENHVLNLFKLSRLLEKAWIGLLYFLVMFCKITRIHWAICWIYDTIDLFTIPLKNISFFNLRKSRLAILILFQCWFDLILGLVCSYSWLSIAYLIWWFNWMLVFILETFVKYLQEKFLHRCIWECCFRSHTVTGSRRNCMLCLCTSLGNFIDLVWFAICCTETEFLWGNFR